MDNTGGQFRSWRWYLDIATTVAMLVAALVVTVVVLKTEHRPVSRAVPRAEPPLPTSPVSLEGASTKGSPSAKVVLLEFTDFECPFCARFASSTLPQIVKKYIETAKVQLALRHRPLSIHPNARAAASAAVCAGKQGKMWEMHDLLFQNNKRLDGASLSAHAVTLALDTTVFADCLTGEGAQQVKADDTLADTAEVRSTPSFLIGVRLTQNTFKAVQWLSGAKGIAEFSAALDEALRKYGKERPARPRTQDDQYHKERNYPWHVYDLELSVSY